jgi:hypothetical protein
MRRTVSNKQHIRQSFSTNSFVFFDFCGRVSTHQVTKGMFDVSELRFELIPFDATHYRQALPNKADCQKEQYNR